MQIIERYFRQIIPKPDSESILKLSFEYFFNEKAIVVLGDPGSGKTTSFSLASQIEEDSVYLKVRDFLSLDAKKRWFGKTIYLDGLDEQRAKTEDGTIIIDKIRGKLDVLNCPKFRLSCRTDDWYGASDIESLRFVSQDEKIVVLSLEPLETDDILKFASNHLKNPESFIDEADEKGIFDLLRNPQTLKMILEMVSQLGKFPETRKELYQNTIEILIDEHNPDHERISSSRFRKENLIDAAGFLCAVQLCGGIEGFAFSKINSNHNYIQIPELGNDTKLTLTAARRRIFISEGPERVLPVHRTIAEFAAAFLISCRTH